LLREGDRGDMAAFMVWDLVATGEETEEEDMIGREDQPSSRQPANINRRESRQELSQAQPAEVQTDGGLSVSQ
jgi:hypothetical protein